MSKVNHKRAKNNPAVPTVRTLTTREDGEEYAVVTKVLGNGRFKVKLNMSERELVARLPGRMKRHKKDSWVELNSVVLVSLRDFQESVVDILQVYNDTEVRRLIKDKEYFEEEGARGGEEEETVEEEIPFNFEEI